MEPGWEVVVVGGGPAGSALAARLGAQGRRVLVVDRAHLPTEPRVPSCPALHMGTLALLDELGLPEAEVAAAGARFDHYVLRFADGFEATVRIPEVHGRAWGYGVDRAAFDHALWRHLARFPSVTRREGFRVEGVVRDASGRVVGVEGRAGEGSPERVEARWVVGADGRFSGVARLLGAAVTENHDTRASTVYFADWEGLGPLRPDDPTAFEVWTDGRGSGLLFIPTVQGRTTVVTHQRADRVDPQGDAEAWYRAVVATYPGHARRFADARPVTRVRGLKRIGNGYRVAAGEGWALVGDAYHFKDPVDGQGIYDALLAGRLLAEELGAALDGRATDAEAAGRYAARADAATRPMFEATLGRLATELYGPPPNAATRTLLRWVLTDPAYGERLLRFLGRDPAVDPARWRPPGFVLGAMARGAGRDIARAFGG